MFAMIDLNDIQHFLIERPRARTAHYEFLTFRNPESGCSWLADISDKVGTAQAVRAAGESEMRWVTVAFTWNGLRALGVDEASLATFPEEFKQGMVARASILGDTGTNAPCH